MINKPTPEEEAIGYKIVDFYCEKYHDTNVATKKMLELKVQSIHLNGEVIEIALSRPGLLIGRKGENINALSEFLGREIKILESFSWDSIFNVIDIVDYFQ